MIVKNRKLWFSTMITTLGGLQSGFHGLAFMISMVC